MHKRSFVLSPAVPAAETDMDIFCIQAEKYRAKGADVIEFYTEPDGIKERSDCLAALGLEGIYLPATYQKRNHSSLCALNEAERSGAVKKAVELALISYNAGLRRALYTSGWYPDSAADEKAAYTAAFNSFRELSSSLPPDFTLLIEPGDRKVQYNQLLGPTDELVKFLDKLGCENVRLTMDISHIAQLGEDVHKSLAVAKKYCSHVHLANCILKKGDPMYGDRHPLFGAENSELSVKDAADMFGWVRQLYNGEDLTVSVEFINHMATDAFAQEIALNTAWFWQQA
ncbi:MAG: TIM barrel protein [Oscillospiraceae bacterium]